MPQKDINIAHELIAALRSSTLKVADFADIILHDQALVDSLVEALQSNYGLRRLDLSDCDLNPANMFKIIGAIRYSRSLVALNLSGNMITPECIALLADMLKQPTCQIKHLYLDNSYACLDVKAAGYLFEAISQNTSVRELSLINANVDDTSVGYLSEALAVNRSIVSLVLDRNEHISSGITRLAHVLRSQNTTLAWLSLDGISIPPESLVILADSLAFNKHIRTLTLSACNLSEVDVCILCQAIERNKDFERLLISDNDLSDAALISIIHLLEQNPSICEVDLSDNQITDISAPIIAEFLETNPNNLFLNLENNKFTEHGSNLIRSSIRVFDTAEVAFGDGLDDDEHSFLSVDEHDMKGYMQRQEEAPFAALTTNELVEIEMAPALTMQFAQMSVTTGTLVDQVRAAAPEQGTLQPEPDADASSLEFKM